MSKETAKLCWHISEQALFEAGDRTLLREVLHPDKSEWRDLPFSLAHAKIEGGERSIPHRLESKEVYYFLEGQGVIYIGASSFKVEAGSVAVVPEKAWQWVENTGASDLVFLCMVAPPWQERGEEVKP